MLIEESIQGFLDEVASDSPAPGGGSVAALSGALGAGLASMVCRLTIGKKNFEGVEEEMKEIVQRVTRKPVVLASSVVARITDELIGLGERAC